MEELSLVLFERMGILLMLTFILTRIPLFRQLLDRELSLSTSLYFSILFGLFGIAGTYAGVVVKEQAFDPSFWILPLSDDESIANVGLAGVVIGGLLGGPVVGVGAGLITGLHLYTLGGFTAFAAGLSAPLTGLLAGLVAQFFSQERVISPAKALFIGMFAPILQMGLILIFSSPPQQTITLVNTIGIPMVLTNSIAIAIFTTMIRVALKEEERSAAFETQRGLKIADLTLPHLMQGLTRETAKETAYLLMRELKAAAVAIANTEYVLAHVGVGMSHHQPGEALQTELAKKAIVTGEVQIALKREHIQCPHPDCPLRASIIVPFSEAGKVVGLIKIYFKRPQQIRKVEEALATGLGKLITHQLNLALTEKMARLMRDTELRVLQAQINPHFLFNTLNSIVTLIRINPDLARHVTIQLGTFIRLNLRATSSQLVPIDQELNHLKSYLEIIRIRFADQFTVHCDVAEGIDHELIPPATLQPLVENSIQHGLKGKPHGGRIDVCIRRLGERVQVTISDNGTGIPDELIGQLGDAPVKSEDGNGIGVYNVNQRLISLFGPESRLQIRNREEGGCRITFSIPSSV
ncbi:MAG: histidine kinase [Brevibacillus sp.]|nr:histidine kinase [Brevibacillus sp.]